MSSRLQRLPWPKKRKRIDLLRPGGKAQDGFETAKEAGEEDAIRVAQIERALAMDSPLIDADRARDLAARLRAYDRRTGPAETLASSRYLRVLRIRVTGALLEFVEPWQTQHVRGAHLLPAAWEIHADDLNGTDPPKLLAQLRSTLNRLGAAQTDGFLIAFIHGEFEPESQVFRLHVHGIAGGGMIDILGKLGTLDGYKPRKDVAHPVKRQKLKNRPKQLSYLLKSYWPSRRIGPVGADGKRKRERAVHRPPEPYHTQYLLWLDQFDLSKITLLMGCKVSNNGLVLTNKNLNRAYMKPRKRRSKEPLKPLK